MTESRLVVIDNALDHGFYRPVEHWAAMIGREPDSIHVPDGGRLPDVGRYSHVIISGCEGSVTELPAWAQAEAEWIEQALAAGTAVLGSCWGHQLLAVIFAGGDAVRRAAHPEFGWLDVSVADTGGLLPNESFQTFASHFDEVVPTCHPEMRVLASTPDCAVQVARWGDRPVWGIQPHPEIDAAWGRAFLEQGLARWPHSEDLLRGALAGPVRDSGDGASIVRRFLESAGTNEGGSGRGVEDGVEESRSTA